MAIFIPQSKAYAMGIDIHIPTAAEYFSKFAVEGSLENFYAKFVFIMHSIALFSFGGYSFPWYVVEGIYNDINNLIDPPPKDADVLFNVQGPEFPKQYMKITYSSGPENEKIALQLARSLMK